MKVHFGTSDNKTLWVVMMHDINTDEIMAIFSTRKKALEYKISIGGKRNGNYTIQKYLLDVIPFEQGGK